LAVLNAVVGIFYYLRVVVAMYFKPSERENIAVSANFNLVIGISAIITILLGIYPNLVANLF